MRQEAQWSSGCPRAGIVLADRLADASTYANHPTGGQRDRTPRLASLFRNGRNQAVRIPREFELEGTEVLMRKEGDRLILTPIRKNRLLDLLASWAPLAEGLPDVEDSLPENRDEL